MVAGRKEETPNRGYAVRTISHRKSKVFDTETRSRLEARWAIFFRELNLKWRYEPEKLYGTGRVYTPDFHIEGFGYVEIKPTLELFIKESAEKVVAIVANHLFILDRLGTENGRTSRRHPASQPVVAILVGLR